MKRLLIDGDSIIYKAGFATEYKIYTLAKDGEYHDTRYVKELKSYLEDGWELISTDHLLEPPENANFLARRIVADMQMAAKTDNITMYLTAPGSTWRSELYPEYKANRTQPKPSHYHSIYEYLSVVFDAEDEPGLEADDLVCIKATQLTDHDIDFVIAHIDKDLDQIPGEHLNYNDYQTYHIDPFYADYYFYTQLLCGDRSDNIPGLRKIGPKTAEKILADCDTGLDMWNRVVAVYAEREPDVGIDEIIRRARLLKLLESRDYEWNPPKP